MNAGTDDLRAASDMVDHTILLHYLHCNHHITGIAPEWFENYRKESCLSIMCGGLLSSTILLEHAVPQGSALRPLLLIIYAANIPHIISKLGQLYYSIKQNNTPVAKAMLEDSIRRVLHLIPGFSLPWFKFILTLAHHCFSS